jgi:hypothetical protein
MNQRADARGGTILFFGTWVLLWNYTSLAEWALGAALALMAVGWLGLRIMGRAVSMQGAKGWWVVAMAVGVALFLWLMPVFWVKKLFVLWAFVLPILIVGAACGWMRARFGWLRWTMRGAPLVVVPLSVFVGIRTSHQLGHPMVWDEWTFLWTVLAASVAFAAGLVLGEGERRETHDARFGTEDQFRHAGMSDER